MDSATAPSQKRFSFWQRIAIATALWPILAWLFGFILLGLGWVDLDDPSDPWLTALGLTLLPTIVLRAVATWMLNRSLWWVLPALPTGGLSYFIVGFLPPKV